MGKNADAEEYDSICEKVPRKTTHLLGKVPRRLITLGFSFDKFVIHFIRREKYRASLKLVLFTGESARSLGLLSIAESQRANGLPADKTFSNIFPTVELKCYNLSDYRNYKTYVDNVNCK